MKKENMTFKIDEKEKEHLVAMAQSERRTSSDFIRWLIYREWNRRKEVHPTLGEVAAAGGEWIKGE